MTEGRNGRNKKNNNTSANDRVIYLNRKEILSGSRRRAEGSAQRRSSTRSMDTEVRRSRPPSSSAQRTGQRTPTNSARRSTQQYTQSMAQRQQSSGSVRRQRPQQSSTAQSRRKPQPARSDVRRRPNPASQQIRRRPVKRSQPGTIHLPGPLPSIELFGGKEASGEKRQYRKVSRRGNNAGMLIVAAVLAVLFLVYIGGYAINMFRSEKIAYETIQIGSVDSAKKADGIIIRSEKVFTAPASGAVEYEVAEGDKIRAGSVVCSVSNAETVAKIQQNLDDINDDIMKLQQTREDISEHTEEVNKLETQIKNLSDENSFDFAGGDFGDVYNLKYSIENKLNTRNQLLLSENSGSLSELVGQRNNELKQINSNIKQITSDVGGIVCYSIDGTESNLTANKVASLSKDEVTAKPEKIESTKTNVAANEAVFKVITSNEWYIASYMPDSYTEGWEVGREMELYLSNGVEADRTLEVTLEVLEHGAKEAYAVFKTDDYMADYMDMRNISFEVDKPKTGFKIPNTAITQQTLLKVPVELVDVDNSTVIKVTQSGDKMLEVTISGTEEDENGKYVLIPVQMGYLSSGDTLKKGDKTAKVETVSTVDGVFLVNSGVTKFVKISTENSVSSGDYTVLDESKNPNLHIYDRVVQNVSNVQENQNIFE